MSATTVLVLGGGGREHALVKALNRSPQGPRVVAAPGNAGMVDEAELRAVNAEDAGAVVALAREVGASLVVVGPEAPLVAGVVDALESAGIAVLGPSREAARLEGSKAHMKEVARAAGVPVAASRSFDQETFALAYLVDHGAPIVVKADGLAAGKGVTVAATLDEAEAAVRECFSGRFGEAGARVLLEEMLTGEEVSAFALCDGAGHALYLGDAGDHKRLWDGDAGPNTGGMGAFSPSPRMTPALRAEVMDRIVAPTLAEMATRGAPFKGVLFCGLMLTDAGLKLLEFNVRLGDPEAQALLPRITGDVLALLEAAAEGRLDDADLTLSDEAALAVVLAAPRYPAEPIRGDVIQGLDEAGRLPGAGAEVCHAATAFEDGRWTAQGGRVLSLVATGATIAAARHAAYGALAHIDWPTSQWRTDIGLRAIPAEEDAA